MFTLLPIAALGFFLGGRHATDPDHVIAVSTIVSREGRVQTAALIGVLWGVGHTVTILVAGGAIVLFEVVIPARVGLTMEFSVALMLILLGGTTVIGVLRARGHPHVHGDYVHAHRHRRAEHGHEEQETPLARLDRRFGRLGLYHVARPLVVGLVHGLAGSAAVALLVVATIHDAVLSLVYLVVFGLGTIAGMMVITVAIALPFAYTARRLLGVNRSLALAAGLLSVGFGLFLAYQIGFVDGLFTGQGRAARVRPSRVRRPCVGASGRRPGGAGWRRRRARPRRPRRLDRRTRRPGSTGAVFFGSPTIPRASMLALPSGWIFPLSVSQPGCTPPSARRRPNSMIAASIARLVAFSWARAVKPRSLNRCAIARTSFTGLRRGDSR